VKEKARVGDMLQVLVVLVVGPHPATEKFNETKNNRERLRYDLINSLVNRVIATLDKIDAFIKINFVK
jgi:hypothetical protein